MKTRLSKESGNIRKIHLQINKYKTIKKYDNRIMDEEKIRGNSNV